MATTASPYGFVPYRRLGGAYFSGGTSRYSVANAYGNNIYYGDAVIRVSDGTIAQSTTTTDLLVGIFQGVEWIDPVTKRPTWSAYFPSATSSAPDPSLPANKPIAYVADDPWLTFKVQANASVSAGDVFALFGITTGTNTSGSTLTGASGETINVASRSTSNNQFRVIDVVSDPSNGWDSAFTDVEVQIVTHAYNTTAGL